MPDTNHDGFDDFEQGNEGGDHVGAAVLIVLSILFLPGAIVAMVLFWMIRFLHLRPHIIVIVAVICSLVGVGMWYGGGGFSSLLRVFSGDISGHVMPALGLNMVLGSIAGLVLVWGTWYQMRNSPQRYESPGDWMYHFRYRRTPIEIARHKNVVESLQQGRRYFPDAAPLGLDTSNDKVVYRYNKEAVRSTLATGAPGSGKSVTMLSLIRNDILNERSLVCIDCKGSPSFAAHLAQWTKEAGGQFYHFANGTNEGYHVPDSPGHAYYDPLANGGDARPGMILNMREYDTSSSVYKSAMQGFLTSLFSVIDDTDPAKTRRRIEWGHGYLPLLFSMLSTGGFAHAVEACRSESVVRSGRTVVEAINASRNSRMKEQMLEVLGYVRTLLQSPWGQWLSIPSRTNGTRIIDLRTLTERPGNTILFSLNATNNRDFSQFLGSLIVSDLCNLSDYRLATNTNTQLLNTYIDEFQDIPFDVLGPLIEKGRESRVGATLSCQSLEQIGDNPSFARSLLDTCSNFIVHQGCTLDSAESFAGIIGKEDKVVYNQTHRSQNFVFDINFRNRRNQAVQDVHKTDWIIQPSELMALGAPDSTRYAYVINKHCMDPDFRKSKNSSRTAARKVQLIPDDAVLETPRGARMMGNASVGNATVISGQNDGDDRANAPIAGDDEGMSRDMEGRRSAELDYDDETRQIAPPAAGESVLPAAPPRRRSDERGAAESRRSPADRQHKPSSPLHRRNGGRTTAETPVPPSQGRSRDIHEDFDDDASQRRNRDTRSHESRNTITSSTLSGDSGSVDDAGGWGFEPIDDNDEVNDLDLFNVSTVLDPATVSHGYDRPIDRPRRTSQRNTSDADHDMGDSIPDDDIDSDDDIPE